MNLRLDLMRKLQVRVRFCDCWRVQRVNTYYIFNAEGPPSLIIYEGPMGWSVWQAARTAANETLCDHLRFECGHRLLILLMDQNAFARNPKSRVTRVRGPNSL